jgi:serine/threonine protein kinase
MAPEQMKGRQATKASDVFAFGLIVYEVLVGESVFPKTGNPLQIARMHERNTRPEIPRGINPSVAKLIRKCWSKTPAHRPTFDEIFNILDQNRFRFFRESLKDVDYAECTIFIAEVIAKESRKGG